MGDKDSSKKGEPEDKMGFLESKTPSTQYITFIEKIFRDILLTLNIPADVQAADETVYLTTLLGPTLMDRLRERGQFWPMLGRSKRQTWKPPARERAQG